MYKINGFKKSVAAVVIMGCIVMTGINAGAASVTKTGNGNTAGIITASTVSQPAASADNSLQSLKLSEGTLSPSFVYNVVNYSATVSADTTSIDVDAVVSDPNATIQSVSGNTDLKEGANTVKVVVAAENGNQATYTITVTRGAGTAGSDDNTVDANETSDNDTNENSDDVTGQTDTPEDTGAVVSGADGYTVSDSIPESVIPADFTQTDITYQGESHKALQWDKGAVVLLYMVDGDSNGMLFVYDQTAETLYPFVKLSSGDNYIILLATPSTESVDESYSAAELTIDGKSVTGAYQSGDEELADYYLVYAVNQEGTGGWYRYDATEGTYQRYTAETGDVTASDEYQFLQSSYTDLNERYSALKTKDTRLITALIIALAVALIIIVNLLFLGNKKDMVEEETADERDDVFVAAETGRKKKRKEQRQAQRDEDELFGELTEDQEAFSDIPEPTAADFEEDPDFLSRKKPKKEKKKKSKKEDIFDASGKNSYFDEEEPLKERVSSLDEDIEIIDLNDL